MLLDELIFGSQLFSINSKFYEFQIEFSHVSLRLSDVKKHAHGTRTSGLCNVTIYSFYLKH